MTGLDVHRSVPDGLPDKVASAFARGEWAGRAGALVALNLGSARQRAILHLGLAQSFLRTGERGHARSHLIEAETTSRSQRLARPLRLEVALTFSLLARQEGHLEDAVEYARQVQRSPTAGAGLVGAAYLASATAQRLAGHALAAVQDVHTAEGFTSGEEVDTARLLTWLAARPLEIEEPPAARMPALSAPFQARLAWTLAERALQAGQEGDARAWLSVALSDPVAWEERRLTPLAAAQSAIAVMPLVDRKAPVRVVTLGRQGLQVGDSFLPVPGDGAVLGILALLVQRGACHLSDVASLILEPEADAMPPSGRWPAGDSALLERRLSMQVRRHLNTVRRLLADPACVQTVRGIVDLASDREWACDALQTGAPRGSQPWLPLLPGTWVSEHRARLAAALPVT